MLATHHCYTRLHIHRARDLVEQAEIVVGADSNGYMYLFKLPERRVHSANTIYIYIYTDHENHALTIRFHTFFGLLFVLLAFAIYDGIPIRCVSEAGRRPRQASMCHEHGSLNKVENRGRGVRHSRRFLSSSIEKRGDLIFPRNAGETCVAMRKARCNLRLVCKCAYVDVGINVFVFCSLCHWVIGGMCEHVFRVATGESSESERRAF